MKYLGRFLITLLCLNETTTSASSFEDKCRADKFHKQEKHFIEQTLSYFNNNKTFKIPRDCKEAETARTNVQMIIDNSGFLEGNDNLDIVANFPNLTFFEFSSPKRSVLLDCSNWPLLKRVRILELAEPIVFANCQNLRRIDLATIKIPKEKIPWAHLGRSLPNLEQLSLVDESIDLAELVDHLERLPSLTILALSSKVPLKDLRPLNRLTNLKQITIPRFYVAKDAHCPETGSKALSKFCKEFREANSK